MSRLDDLRRFYELLDDLEKRAGGRRRLADCSGRLLWPQRGVYFFFEEGEERTDSGRGARVVRVGTHALKSGSSATLWKRLSQHQGVLKTGAGNHRGSIFRLILGAALLRRGGRVLETWGVGSDPGKAATRFDLSRAQVKQQELELEQLVSETVRSMSILWVGIDDEPGPASARGIVERGAIALLSNYGKSALDPPSPSWLGLHSDREKVRASSLWNSNHVEERHDSQFLNTLEELVAVTASA